MMANWKMSISMLLLAAWPLRAQMGPEHSEQAFEKLKSLEGVWSGTSERGGKSFLTYTVVGRGSAVREDYSDADGDRMLTVFYLQDGQLMLRHFCVAKNQPLMKAAAYSAASGDLKFDFVDATNLPEGGGHMHTISMRFTDTAHLISGATYFKNGKPSFSESTTYTRVEDSRANEEAEKQDVLSVIDRLTAAGIKRDVAAIQGVYSPDYFHTNADGSVMDLPAVVQSYTAPTEFRFDGFRTAERRAVLRDRTAIVSQALSLHGFKGNDSFISRYRVTYVLIRDRDGWKVVNSHASLLGIDPGKRFEGD